MSVIVLKIAEQRIVLNPVQLDITLVVCPVQPPKCFVGLATKGKRLGDLVGTVRMRAATSASSDA